MVISDETYMHFVYDGAHWSAASVADWRRTVIVVGTCSKSFGMMGWRVGFLMADRSICEQAVKVQDAMIICAPVTSQVAAEAAVRECWRYAESHHGELRARRRVLMEALAAVPGIEWTPTRAGLFAFARVIGCADAASLAHELLEHAHVVTIAGSFFGASGEGHLRLSYGYAGAADIAEAATRLRAVVGRSLDAARR
jgi:aminotransferase